MASLRSVRVPPNAVPVLKRLADLDDDQSSAIVSALSTGSVRDKSSLEAAVREVVGDDWRDDEVGDLVGNLISMSTLAASHRFTAGAVTEALIRRAGDSFSEDESQTLIRRLTDLIGAHDLLAYSKAADIYTEFDRLLHLSRIITDIRPVFGVEADSDPLGAVIVHTLRLDYFHSGRIQTLSFALSSKDLEDLKEVVERAQVKEDKLTGVLDAAGLIEFDIAEDADV